MADQCSIVVQWIRYLKSSLLLSALFFLFFFATTVLTQTTVVQTLPGFSGTLPFKLETGYIGVREFDEEDLQLFYYFVESESDPENDPLVLWLTGGPGCSAFSGLVFEIGPLNFNFDTFDVRLLPSLLLNPYSWTKVASIIFLDAPVGTGFSYAKTPEGYNTSDTQTVDDIYSFLRQWFLNHPNFIKNRLYIAGDSYAGKWVPMIAWKISEEENNEEIEPKMTLEGYIIGNPLTDLNIDINSRLAFAHRLALLSDKYYKMAKVHCRGNYMNPNPENVECTVAIKHYEECTNNVFANHVLEPTCESNSQKTNKFRFSQMFMEDDASIRIMQPFNSKFQFQCRDDFYLLSFLWANDPKVQEALHIRKGTIKEWKRCDRNLPFVKNRESVVHYHKLLSNKQYQALAYSGDHDMIVPYIGTMEWIRLLNLTLVDDWRPWIVDAQIAGYTERYANEKGQYNITFATVKGAGHTAPEYKGKECLAMLKRFLSYNPL